MQFSFQRIAIVNRGEPARRLITAVRELTEEYGHPLRTIALYTDPDRRAMFVRDADEAYSLGPATYVDPRDGERKSSYLDYGRLERALRATRAEAVWVGWGFVAEHAAFADLCERLGIVFIGPSGDVMRSLGDKIRSKQAAEKADVPVAPWSGGAVDSLDDARVHAERLGFPLMIKATAGGGGRGIRRVMSMDDLADAFESARMEALRGFGDATVFMERLVTGARHVEVQIIADRRGTTWALGVRDCSVQRRNQKVVEESPSPALTEAQQRELCAAAARLGEAVGYTNAGTVEFLYDAKAQRFSFMEVNARLQVEHPVTEMITGVDLVKLQLHVAAGGALEGEPPAAIGHAIEVRLNAEDPENNFAPAPGKIALFRLPIGSGLRIDTGVETGDEVASEFDSMIAKFIAHGRTRAEALARLRRALAESAVVIRGGMSNKGFLLELLGRPELASGEYDVGWLDRLVVAGEHVSHQHVEIALVYAAIAAYEADSALERLRFFQSAARGRPELGEGERYRVELGHQSARYEFEVQRLGTRRYQVTAEGRVMRVAVEVRGELERRLVIGDSTHRVLAMTEGASSLIEVDGVPHRISHDSAGVVRSPAPAVVVSVAVQAGDEVEIGDRLAVLEAMKTEMPIVAKFAGRVREVLVQNNVQVPPGAPLLVIDAPEGEGASAAATPVDFDALAAASKQASRDDRQVRDLRRLMLGFDADADSLRRIITQHGVLTGDRAPDDPELWATEGELLAIFADLLALFRRRREDSDEFEDTRLSTAEYLLSYLRDIGGKGEGLPPLFLDKLRQALAHYGVTELDPTPDLEEALFRIYKSHHRVDDQITPVLSVLQRRLDHADAVAGLADGAFRQLLDRLVGVSHGRFPAVNDLAREARYRFYEQPVLEQARDRIYREAETHIDYLSANPEAEDREDTVAWLVSCPQPLKTFMSQRLPGADAERQGLMLEIMVRRYYRIRELENLRCQEHGGEHVLLGEYDLDGARLSVVAAHVPEAGMATVLAEVAKVTATLPAGHDVVIDLYALREGPLAPVEEAARAVGALIGETTFARPIRRVVVAISPSEGPLGIGGVQHFTFRPDDSGRLVEEPRFRGLHPMMTKRLRLWRLAAFDIERLASADDIYLFRGIARDNPKDERLFALAEVRDLTPVEDERGRVVGLPHLERQLMETLNAIRRVQAQRPTRQRLHWNRVQLFAWPVLAVEPHALGELIHRLAPATEGLGIERVLLEARVPDPQTGAPRPQMIDVSNPEGHGLSILYREPPTEPMKPLDLYTQKVVRLRQRGLIYPYEILKMLTPARDGVQSAFPPGEFIEHDLDDSGERLVPVSRPPGENQANMVAGLVRNYTAKYPEGITRVVLAGDPIRGMGALAEPECRRINAAIALASELQVPLEWYALSAGAKIAMDSGTENMDWIALVLRRLIEFTQDGGEVNIVVTGINVGAQPYWNAEATMLMHTRGILIMVDGAAMVLTGKRALDYSGGVSAEDNTGIGGYERIMGPNGQAQYYADDISEACQLLLRHYEHTYVVPGERFPRRAKTTDPTDRDVCTAPHARGLSFAHVGDVFSEDSNPGRKKAFDIRSVMKAAIDQDHDYLERWFGQRDAEVAVVWDAHVGGYPVCMLGIESRPVPRLGFVPADGPAQWTAGTLFPLASKKVARSINAASGNRPVVVLANLSGFDGSPESMRNVQLEYGAEIGRAVVNFRGPIVFCVVSRYHGGAFVVFSNKLNESLEVAAVEGTQASVIGGAPAAAVVFAREVDKRAQTDERVLELQQRLSAAVGAEKVRLRSRYDDLFRQVHSEKLGEVAAEFDRVHSVHRAQKVGSVHHIIAPARLRPYLVEALERGIQRELERVGKQA
ncbi:carboxyl transferase domain-containing protein [Haliangium sp.]|uniref:ATP-binding protein n=1 Tax=Haliangium sp. TaxID=2663208 RepID=UPI003D0E4AF6